MARIYQFHALLKKTFFRLSVFFLLALAGCTSSSSEEGKEPEASLEETSQEEAASQEDSSLIVEDDADQAPEKEKKILDQSITTKEDKSTDLIAGKTALPALAIDKTDTMAQGKEVQKKSTEDSFAYRVRPKDTLSLIAKKVFKTKKMWKSIHEKNPSLKNPNKIYPGQLLVVPKLNQAAQDFAKKYEEQTKTITITVKKGDNLSKLAAKHLGSASLWTQIAEQNQDTVKNPNQIEVGQTLTFQVYGSVASR